MGLPRFPRIEDLLGARLDSLGEQHLREIVGRAGTNPVREDADLDFKEALYADNRQADLAADVAAMANSRGGVLLIGIRGDDIAAALSPVQITDAEERRMRQIIADRVFPRPNYEIAAIPLSGSPDQGVFIVAIPKSSFAPHAAKDGGLRYYVRDGARNRPLSESEVADAYKNRFELARAQADRLSEVDAEAIESYPHIQTWLRLSLVPTMPGSMPVTSKRVADVERWVQDFRTSQSYGDGPFFAQKALYVSTGVARFTLTNTRGPIGDEPDCAYAELHTNGAGLVAVIANTDSPLKLDLENTVLEAFAMIRLLVTHAVSNTGASGDALVMLSTGGDQRRKAQFGRTDCPDGFQPLPQTRIGLLPRSRHTIDLESVAADPQEQLLVTKMVLTDWVQAVGLPEVPQIAADGSRRRGQWRMPTNDWRRGAAIPES
jgi:hypothetical protein